MDYYYSSVIQTMENNDFEKCDEESIVEFK